MRVVAAEAARGGAPSSVSARVTAARSAPGSSRTTSRGSRPGSPASSRCGLHPADPAVVLERAHDPGDAEAHLGAARQLGGQRRPRPQPERVGQPEPDLDLARRAHAPALGERRRLELGVVAGVGDEPQRLAEPERVRGLDRVALARGVDAGHVADRRRAGTPARRR